MEGLEIFFIVYCLFWGIGVISFCLRLHREPLKSRNRTVVLLQTIFSLIYFAMRTYSFDSCIPKYYMITLVVPFTGMPYVYRGFHLWFKYILNQKTLKVNSGSEDSEFRAAKPVIFKTWTTSNRWVLSLRFHLLFYFLFGAIFAMISLFIYYFQMEVYALSCLSSQAIVVSVQTAILFITALILMGVLVRVKDSFHIKFELQIMTFIGLPLLILSSICYYIPTLLPLWLSGENVVLVYISLSLLVSIYIPTILSFSKVVKLFTGGSFQQRSVDLGGKGDHFYECLQNPKMAKSFEEFCVESFAVENLFFYRHAVGYRGLKGEFQKTEAYRIRHEYISHESVFEVDLLPRTKERILKRIEQGDIDVSLFLEAEQEIYLGMRQSIYPLWKRSDMYKKAGKSNFLFRSKSFFTRSSQFITPSDIQSFEIEKARRKQKQEQEPQSKSQQQLQQQDSDELDLEKGHISTKESQLELTELDREDEQYTNFDVKRASDTPLRKAS